jgi:hypothetical protein
MHSPLQTAYGSGKPRAVWVLSSRNVTPALASGASVASDGRVGGAAKRCHIETKTSNLPFDRSSLPMNAYRFRGDCFVAAPRLLAMTVTKAAKWVEHQCLVQKYVLKNTCNSLLPRSWQHYRYRAKMREYEP